MKSYYSSIALSFVMLSAFQPLLKADNGHNNGVLAGAVCAAFAAGGAICGGITAWWHNSSAKKQQEAEKEKKIIQGVQALLEKIKKHARLGRLLLEHPQPSYQDIATIHAGRELADVKDQLGSFLTAIKEQKEQLSLVTGKYGEASEACYTTAQSLYDDVVKFEQTMVHYQELVHKLEMHRETPLITVKDMEPFIQRVQSQAHSSHQFLNFVKGAYGAAVTHDEIKGLPLVCAAEDISHKLAELERCKHRLEAHQRLLQTRDHMLDATLAQLYSWQQLLNKAAQVITSTHHYDEQVRDNKTAKIARLNAQSEYERERKERAKTEKDLVDARNEERRLEIRNAELAVQKQQAFTNAVNSTANAMGASVELSNVRKELDQERRDKKLAEEELRAVKARVRELEQRLKDHDQQLRRQRENYTHVTCPIHRVDTSVCPPDCRHYGFHYIQ